MDERIASVIAAREGRRQRALRPSGTVAPRSPAIEALLPLPLDGDMDGRSWPTRRQMRSTPSCEPADVRHGSDEEYDAAPSHHGPADEADLPVTEVHAPVAIGKHRKGF